MTCLSFIPKWPHCAINVTDRISVIERRIYQGTFDKPLLYAMWTNGWGNWVNAAFNQAHSEELHRYDDAWPGYMTPDRSFQGQGLDEMKPPPELSFCLPRYFSVDRTVLCMQADRSWVRPLSRYAEFCLSLSKEIYPLIRSRSQHHVWLKWHHVGSQPASHALSLCDLEKGMQEP